MSALLHKCMTKATTAKGDQRQYGPNWVVACRCSLQVYEDRLECGDWRIDYSEIKNAVLCSFQTLLLRIPGYILTVDTADQTYHFGLNGWGKFWKSPLPFEVKREQGKLGFTWFSFIMRVILFVGIAYMLWQRIASR